VGFGNNYALVGVGNNYALVGVVTQSFCITKGFYVCTNSMYPSPPKRAKYCISVISKQCAVHMHRKSATVLFLVIATAFKKRM